MSATRKKARGRKVKCRALVWDGCGSTWSSLNTKQCSREATHGQFCWQHNRNHIEVLSPRRKAGR